jgi:Ca2+-transporting ATPase
VLAGVGLGACVVAVVAFAVTRGGSANAWKQGFLAGVAMAMAILPEELPVILTVFLALGAWRLSQRKVLARRMPAVETLGATTVLCVDKTGTLTENHMTLRRLVTSTGDDVDLAPLVDPLAEVFHDTLEHAILASKRDPFDPMERALHEAGDRFVKDTEHLHPAWSLVRAYPLSTALLAMTHVWRAGEESTLTVATKGAPEAVAELCRLEPDARAKLDALVAGLGSQGLRVLAVAKGTVTPEAVPEDVHAFSLAWVGLLAFEDPLRAAVPAAVAECRAAGVRVVMITGDNAITAQHIASAAGLGSSEVVLTGPQLAALDDDALASVVGTVGVFARVAPDQKLRIVRAFKAAGELVAMTGDGVNDAPALRAAHIGVAMGGRGTDVAREAASLVLLDDDFASLVQAIALGRRIFDNLKRAIVFTLAVHVPIAGLSLLPVFFGRWPLLLLPVHIVFLELVIDPTCSLVFEAEAPESDVMQRPPRDANERLFSSQTSWLALAQGASVLAASFAAFFVARSRFDVDSARSLVFVTLVSGIVTILLVNRSWSRSAVAMVTAPNAALRWVLLGTTIALVAAVLTGVGQRLFHFGPASPPALGLALLAGVVSLAWFEIVKQVWIRRAREVGSPNASARARTGVVK